MLGQLTRISLLLAFATLLAGEAFAQDSPVGTWRTIDDRSGEPRSLVEILQEEDGTYSGYIRHLFDEERADALCEVCPSDWGQNQPVVGLQIIRDVERRGDDYRGGQIMDPEEGKVYGVRLNTSDDGATLDVRGFIRVPLMGSALGRTQTWERVE